MNYLLAIIFGAVAFGVASDPGLFNATTEPFSRPALFAVWLLGACVSWAMPRPKRITRIAYIRTSDDGKEYQIVVHTEKQVALENTKTYNLWLEHRGQR